MTGSATDAAVDRARLYQRSRPPYADEVVDFAAQGAAGGTFNVIADIGCGTGISTRPFRRLAAHLVGVEPDAGMRTVASECLAGLGVTVMAGHAEATGLADHTVDLVVAASCFEWFQPSRVAAEFGRVLVPGQPVLLMWNHRVALDDSDVAWDRLWSRHMGPRLGPAPEDIRLQLVPAFLDSDVAVLTKVARHPYNVTRLESLALSSAYAPRPRQQRRRAALMAAIAAFHAEYERGGFVELAFETVAFLGRPRPAPAEGVTAVTGRGWRRH